jgi:hypothetical protein
MKDGLNDVDGKKIAIFLVEDFASEEGKVYRITGTAQWNEDTLRIRDVDWGKEFDMPPDVLDAVCPADEHTRSIVPDADYVVCMPLVLYPHPWWHKQ